MYLIYYGGMDKTSAKTDMQFLLWQLCVIEHMQDREGIAAVAKRHGIVFPIYANPFKEKMKLKAKDRRKGLIV